MDLSALYIEPTQYTAQTVGGLLFGAGFLVGGYCPGTSMAAITTGRKDGLVFALGMLAGVYAYAEFTPGIDAWYQATASGEITLPSLTGIGMCRHPAPTTAAKQPRPSLVTRVAGSKLASAHLPMASSVKPRTRLSLSCSGWPWALSETAATNGTLFSEPRPALPPVRLRVIELHGAAQAMGDVLLGHGAIDLLVQQPGRGLAHSELTLERQGR